MNKQLLLQYTNWLRLQGLLATPYSRIGQHVDDFMAEQNRHGKQLKKNEAGESPKFKHELKY